MFIRKDALSSVADTGGMYSPSNGIFCVEDNV